VFTLGHIPTKLHQFLVSSFLDFLWTDTQRDALMLPKTIPVHSMRACNDELAQQDLPAIFNQVGSYLVGLILLV